MHFEPNEVYHVYNRGNNKQNIFFQERNYRYFLEKIIKEWKKYCDILCYCLMPNHFHFMLTANQEACKRIMLADKETELQKLSKQIGLTLSSYTKAINVQNNTTGTLFQKKTKAKLLMNDIEDDNRLDSIDQISSCLLYIHRNPLKAGLVQDLNNWKYSSWHDYADLKHTNICNKKKLLEFTRLTSELCKSENLTLNKRPYEHAV